MPKAMVATITISSERRNAVARTHVIADVRPVEAGDDQTVSRDAELDENVLARAPVRRGRERQPRDGGKGVEQRPQQPVIGPEIMPPFGNAMRLVDRHQRQRYAPDQVPERVARRPFGRHVDEVELAPLQPRHRLLAIAVGRGERGGADSETFGGADLVVHQRDQRRDDERRARPRQRRHLVAQRLARAGRHHGQRVPPRHDAPDHLLLDAAKRVEAEGAAQNVERRGHPSPQASGQGKVESHRGPIAGTKAELQRWSVSDAAGRHHESARAVTRIVGAAPRSMARASYGKFPAAR
jgi:hypothetical protein